MQGRRIPVNADGSPGKLEQAGDYCGPVLGYTGKVPAVLFLLPNSRDPGATGLVRAIHHVVSPPHTFTEEADGSLTIAASIDAQQLWHGFLERGVWREC